MKTSVHTYLWNDAINFVRGNGGTPDFHDIELMADIIATEVDLVEDVEGLSWLELVGAAADALHEAGYREGARLPQGGRPFRAMVKVAALHARKYA